MLTLNVSRQALTNGPCLMNIMHRPSLAPSYWCQYVHNLSATNVFNKWKILTVSNMWLFQSLSFNRGSKMKPDRLLSSRPFIMYAWESPLLWRYCFIQPPTTVQSTLGCFRNTLFQKKNRCTPVRTPPGYKKTRSRSFFLHLNYKGSQHLVKNGVGPST